MIPELNCSFQPNGSWFVFDQDSGETLQKNLVSKAAALNWLYAAMGKLWR